MWRCDRERHTYTYIDRAWSIQLDCSTEGSNLRCTCEWLRLQQHAAQSRAAMGRGQVHIAYNVGGSLCMSQHTMAWTLYCWWCDAVCLQVILPGSSLLCISVVDAKSPPSRLCACASCRGGSVSFQVHVVPVGGKAARASECRYT